MLPCCKHTTGLKKEQNFNKTNYKFVTQYAYLNLNMYTYNFLVGNATVDRLSKISFQHGQTEIQYNVTNFVLVFSIPS